MARKLLIALLPALALLVYEFAAADSRNCELCQKPIPPGKGISATVKQKVRHFRCIHCALTGLKSERSAYAIHAKTPLDHKSVTLLHRNGSWQQKPPSTVFLILPERANECLDVHQPFASKAEFDRYLKRNPAIAAQKPRAYTIADYEKMLNAGKPR